MPEVDVAERRVAQHQAFEAPQFLDVREAGPREIPADEHERLEPPESAQRLQAGVGEHLPGFFAVRASKACRAAHLVTAISGSEIRPCGRPYLARYDAKARAIESMTA